MITIDFVTIELLFDRIHGRLSIRIYVWCWLRSKHLSLSSIFSGVRVDQSLVFCVVFCKTLLSFWTFLFWTFLTLRPLITLLVPSNCLFWIDSEITLQNYWDLREIVVYVEARAENGITETYIFMLSFTFVVVSGLFEWTRIYARVFLSFLYICIAVGDPVI